MSFSLRTSRNKRTTDRGNVNLADVVKAIRVIKQGNEKVRTAAKSYNLPRTTLRRYLEKISTEYKDISAVTDEKLQETIKRLGTYAACAVKQVFSTEEEEALVCYTKQCCNHYYGLSITELRKLAYQFANKIQAKYPPNWDANGMAGRDWYYGFMRRHHELSLRTPEQTSLNRVKAFCKENVQVFFRNLDMVLSKHPFQAADIWNMDETGFSTVPTKIGKVISVRGMRRVGQIAAQERGTMVTMALAVNAEGISVPPFFLFPRQKLQSTFLENASPGAIGFANGSGWMQQAEFVKYMEFFVDKTKASKQSPKVLLVDNHASHLSIDALELAVDNGVTLLSFPPHCSHRLQPLDVSVYGPVKAYYKSQCNAWQKNHAGKYLEIRHIAGLVASALDLALTPRNIKAGFLATGIVPYNPDIFADSEFVQAVFSGENDRAVMEAEVYNEELQRRIVVSDVPEVSVHEEVATEPLPSTSRECSISSILTTIGPLQAAMPAKLSKRGRRPMHSTVLTSPESISTLYGKQQKRSASKTPKNRAASAPTKSSKKTPARRGRPPKTTQKKSVSDEDEDFK